MIDTESVWLQSCATTLYTTTAVIMLHKCACGTPGMFVVYSHSAQNVCYGASCAQNIKMTHEYDCVHTYNSHAATT